MQIQFLWGPKTKYLPQVAVIGNRCHALRATSHHHRHLRQLRLKYKSGPSATCEAKLRAQVSCELKNAHRRCGPTNDPNQDLRHTNTPVAVTDPPGTAVTRKGSSQTEHGPLNSSGGPQTLRLAPTGPARYPKTSISTELKRFETTDVVSLPPQARQYDSVHP